MRVPVFVVCVLGVLVLCARGVFVVCVRARVVLCLFVGGARAHNVLLLTFFYFPLHIIYMNFIYIICYY